MAESYHCSGKYPTITYTYHEESIVAENENAARDKFSRILEGLAGENLGAWLDIFPPTIVKEGE